jgi:multidrug efflux pump subunit AcrA (membrane-fusion protein)
MLIRDTAVGQRPGRPFVYVVAADGTVEQRTVVTGRSKMDYASSGRVEAGGACHHHGSWQFAPV